MDFSTDADNDIVKGMEDQLSTQGQARDASDQAKQAWELAKTQAQGQYRPDQPEYWPHVQQLSYELLGLKQDADRPIIQSPGMEPTAQSQSSGPSISASRPLQMGQDASQTPNPMNPTPPKKNGYPNYGEGVRRVKNKSTKTADKIFNGIDWVTAAKNLTKELKDADINEENVIFSLVNRIGLSPETAKQFYDGTYKEELDEATIREDNVYNHMSIVTRSGYPYEDYGMDNNRDPFEWEMSSTRYVAKALVIDGRYTYECRFEILQSDTARWPHTWKFLSTDHDVHFVLKVSVNQLNVNSNYMRLTPDATPISFSNESNLLKTMKSMFASYNKIWGSSSYQLIILGSQNVQKLTFLLKLAKSLEGSGIKVHEDISTELTQKATEDTAQRNMMYIALTNSKGGKIKESYSDKEWEVTYTDFEGEHTWDRFDSEAEAKAECDKLNNTSTGTFGPKNRGPRCIYTFGRVKDHLPPPMTGRPNIGTPLDSSPRTHWSRGIRSESTEQQISKEKSCSTCRSNPPEENRDRCKFCLKGHTQWNPKKNDTWNESYDFIDEVIWDEEVNSSAFNATPFDAKHDFCKDGEVITNQATQNLKAMGIIDSLKEFEIKHNGDKWDVVGHKGDIKGSHDSEEEAKKQIAAIYANGYKPKD